MHGKEKGLQNMAENYTINPNVYFMVKAYLSATFGTDISDLFDLCLHWVSVVRGLMYTYSGMYAETSMLYAYDTIYISFCLVLGFNKIIAFT